MIICAITAIVTFVVVFFFIRPKYSATSIIYAPRTNGLSQIILNENTYNERLDIKAYAVEEETEQMMQILQSRPILDSLVKRNDLHKHYNIPENQPNSMYKMYKVLENTVTIKRTQYGAISIEVADWDPVKAAAMANDIVAMLDTVKNRTEHERAVAAYNLLQKQDKLISAEIKVIADSLQLCMEHGLYFMDIQSERLTQQYAIAVAQNNEAAKQRLKKEFEAMAPWGSKSLVFRKLLDEMATYQLLCKAKLLNAKMDMESGMPVKFVVEEAVPADRKFYPKTVMITFISTVSVFFLSLFSLLIYESILNSGIAEKKEDEV
jgi:uncharacterized protein involved in exopolysaccharide biosynthesis